MMDAPLFTNKQSGSWDAIYSNNNMSMCTRNSGSFQHTLAAISMALLATPVSLNAIVVSTNGKTGDVACNVKRCH